MSYTDTSFTAASGYTYIHAKQVYDQFATQLGTHAAWSFVESVDYVNGTTTITTYVWKCSAAVSGLSADFYIGFQVYAISGVYQTAVVSSISPLTLVLFEQYNSTTHTASKMATYPVSSSQTTAADATNTSTWVLNTARPSNQPNYVTWANAGPAQSSTGGRLLLLVTPTGVTGGYRDSAASPIMHQFYLGAFDSLLNSTDEPLALVCFQGLSGSTGAFNQNGVLGSTTRHPKRGSYTGSYLFGVGPYYGFTNNGPSSLSNSFIGGAPVLAISYALVTGGNNAAGGVLGYSAETQVNLFTGSVPASRLCFSQFNLFGGNASTLGGMRGYFKNWLGAPLAAHSFGDTFTIDAKTYVGFGTSGAGVMDTTA